MLKLILDFYQAGQKALENNVQFGKIAAEPVREEIGRFKYTEEDKVDAVYDELIKKLDADIDKMIKEAGEADD